MFGFTRAQSRLLIAAGLCLLLSAAIEQAGNRLTPPLVLVRAAETPQEPAGAGPASFPGEGVQAAEGASQSARAAGSGQGPPVAGEKSASPGQRRDLNEMGYEDLIQLPGIGPVLAQRILEYRAAHGPFLRLEQLLEVPGIGPARYRQLIGHVSIGSGTESGTAAGGEAHGDPGSGPPGGQDPPAGQPGAGERGEGGREPGAFDPAHLEAGEGSPAGAGGAPAPEGRGP